MDTVRSFLRTSKEDPSQRRRRRISISKTDRFERSSDSTPSSTRPSRPPRARERDETTRSCSHEDDLVFLSNLAHETKTKLSFHGFATLGVSSVHVLRRQRSGTSLLEIQVSSITRRILPSCSSSLRVEADPRSLRCARSLSKSSYDSRSIVPSNPSPKEGGAVDRTIPSDPIGSRSWEEQGWMGSFRIRRGKGEGDGPFPFSPNTSASHERKGGSRHAARFSHTRKRWTRGARGTRG